MRKKKILAGLITFAITLAILVPFTFAFAQSALPGQYRPDAADQLAIAPTVTLILQYVLGFLGLVAVIIIIIGGVKWMTSGGDEKKVKSAQQTILAGAIGLIIILSAWVIVKLVLGGTTDLLTDAAVVVVAP